MKIDNETLKGHIASLCTNLIFGLNINVLKSLFDNAWISPLGNAIFRSIFGFLLFWTIGFFSPKEKIPPRDLLKFLGAALLGMCLGPITFSLGLNVASPVIMSMIASLNPFFVLILSALILGEHITLKKGIGVLAGITGAAILISQSGSSGGGENNFLGVILALISVMGISVYFIIIRRTAVKYSGITIMKWMFLFGFIVLLPLSIYELPRQGIFTPGVSLLPVLQLAFSLIFSCGVAVFLQPVALRRISASSSSMYTNVQPLTATVMALVLGQDILTWDKPLALILIVFGVYLVNHRISTARKRKQEGGS